MPTVPPSSHTSIRRARRMRGHGRVVQLVPAERVGRIAQRGRVRGVLVVDDRAVAGQGARAGAEAGADVTHATGRGLGEPFAQFGVPVHPADVDEARDERGPGQVVEQQVQWRAAGHDVGELLGDGGAQSAAGLASHEPFETFRHGIGLDAPYVTLATGHGVEVRAVKGHGLPVRWREQVAGPSLQMQVGTQTVGPEHENGRGAADRAGPALGGPRGGVRRRGAQRRHRPSPFSQIMFSCYVGPKGRRTFRTTLLTKAQVNSV